MAGRNSFFENKNEDQKREEINPIYSKIFPILDEYLADREDSGISNMGEKELNQWDLAQGLGIFFESLKEQKEIDIDRLRTVLFEAIKTYYKISGNDPRGPSEFSALFEDIYRNSKPTPAEDKRPNLSGWRYLGNIGVARLDKTIEQMLDAVDNLQKEQNASLSSRAPPVFRGPGAGHT